MTTSDQSTPGYGWSCTLDTPEPGQTRTISGTEDTLQSAREAVSAAAIDLAAACRWLEDRIVITVDGYPTGRLSPGRHPDGTLDLEGAAHMICSEYWESFPADFPADNR